ncbi:hypothetical protein EJ05DRAFT_540651 [Pseudovirgaria hyperparasitica]|uniref:1-phosphatidylinositol-3-phosphate 5-kinase n=1 Tax=Pseudovirgaria hyperparasitica TaxID=470096 RepID=A0A6A6VYB6_9PEZI|nr:uncharacterized protein EJ05DRAFT_540651 [Pseudovirgaria hyperparasitica]KAF2755195.1 hypothetical protein EJ05DRAFT_540651 [Pseudovirgaria hyperparasitica]
MTSQDTPNASSPSSSSIRLPLDPLARRSRRSSLVSISSTKGRVDKETMNMALDQIHSSASRSETLTTFDQFASPPSSSQGYDTKSIAGDIVHGGLSGLYDRFRASVENAKEAFGTASPVLLQENADTHSTHSLWTKTLPKHVRTSSSKSHPSSTAASTSSSKLSSPLGTTFTEPVPPIASNPDKSNVMATVARTGSVTSRSPLVLQGKSKPSIATSTVESLDIIPAQSEAKETKSPSYAPVAPKPCVDAAAKDTVRSKLSRDEQRSIRMPVAESSRRTSKPSADFQNHDADSSDNEIVLVDEKGDIEMAKADEDALMKDQGTVSGTRSNHQASFNVANASSATGTISRATAASTPTPSRPPLLQISQSHLPGYRPSRASSSDGGLSSSTVVASKPPPLYIAEEPNYINNNSTTDNLPNNVFSQMRRKVLSKEFWMRDENAKDCFYCGDPFSTFRRKHHCRTCGQIFDSKCTSLVSGRLFGQGGTLRVCKPCEAIIYGNEDDSSDFSEDADGSSLYDADDVGQAHTVRHPATVREGEPMKIGTPTISIPMSRKAGEGKRRSAVIELDRSPTLARPSSSRSLRSLSGRPRSSTGHKRHTSKNQHMRNVRYDDRAPFHRHAINDFDDRLRLPAFHHDNIIDPDLAPFMSDEESSEDEQVSIFATLSGHGHSRHDGDRNQPSNILTGSRKLRSRGGDKGFGGSQSIYSRDPDNASITSRHLNRHSRRRNISVSSNVNLKTSPKRIKSSGLLRNLAIGFGSGLGQSSSGLQVPTNVGGSKMIRSSSMRGRDAPIVELNAASLQHVRRLLRQLLQDGSIPHSSGWERALMPILLQCTDDVNPDVQQNDDIDIRHYIKLKKIPGGKPGDTSYVSGVVFSKNLALKSMARSIPNPRIIIVTFAIEYARHQQHFMSLEPVIAQEREYLRNLVNRIAALQPHVLLVQRNVAGLALEFLEEARIAVAYNVKPSVLNAVSRCTRARMISSVDKLAGDPAHLGHCASFDIKTYRHGGIKKTYTYLSGCQRELGCTIVLRGASVATLRTLKKITEFMCYVVYNLKLETCLMRDECVLIPSSVDGDTLSSRQKFAKKVANVADSGSFPPHDVVARASHQIQMDREKESAQKTTYADITDGDIIDSRQADHVVDTTSKNENLVSEKSNEYPDDIPMPSFYGEMVEKHKTKILSASPFVTFMQPYLLTQSREQERRLAYLKKLRDQYTPSDEKETAEQTTSFELVQPEMVHDVPEKASRQVRDFLHAVHNAEYEKAMHNYNTQRRQWEAYLSGNMELFDPFNHQRIAVLYSAVNSVTSTPCFGPEIIALGFYNEHDLEDGFMPDCSLGQYIEDLCHGGNNICESAGCDRKMFDHHRQYVHGEGQLSVFVQKHATKIRGLQNTVLMWSVCRICQQETQPFPMSDNTWKYSFAKYLELTFWSSQLQPRADSADACTHDIHKDHVRYFGLNNVALRFQYDKVQLYEVIVPRPIVTWKVDSDLRLKNEQFARIEERLDKFYASIKTRLKGIHIDSIVPEKYEACKAELEKLTKRANDEQDWLKKKLQDKYMSSRYYEIVPLNRAVRAIVEKVFAWDDAFVEFERQFFPSEKDIRRLAALQLKKMFLERDESVGSLTSVEEDPEDTSTEGSITTNEKADLMSLTPMPSQMSPEKARDMLTLVVEEDHNKESEKPITPHDNAISKNHTSNSNTEPAVTAAQSDVRHLNLALPSKEPESIDDITPRPSPAIFTGDPPILEMGHGEGNNEQQSSSEETIPMYESRIPRPVEVTKKTRPAVLSRASSQPGVLSSLNSLAAGGSSSTTSGSLHRIDPTKPSLTESAKALEKRVSDRLGLTFKGSKSSSMIPRSIPSKRDSRVSTLAKHFEQLSREFEKERLRERRQRAEKFRQARTYQLASSKPVVEVYRNVHEAVQVQDPSEEDLRSSSSHQRESTDASTLGESGMTEATETTTGTQSPDNDQRPVSAEDSPAGSRNDGIDGVSQTDDVEGEGSDAEVGNLDDMGNPSSLDESQILSPTEANLELLPKHEKTSLMKMLTSFWSERSASGWAPLEYPFSTTEHVWEDSDIIVREDEPSSIIALALSSPDYMAKLQSFRASNTAATDADAATGLPIDDDVSIERNLLHQANTNIRYSFTNRGVRAQCKIFYAQSFDALRRKCGVADRFVESLSRCLKWDSKGGKSKSLFLRTLDDRFILKSLSAIEVNAFFRFAPNYFAFTHQNLFKGLPTVIAKMFGLFQVQIKTSTGRDFDMFMLVMENLFYDREPNRRFDLKGSMRNRKIQSTGERDEVLLDENLVDIIYSETPIFVREHTKKLLKASVWNDTLFLSKQNVMDYSLMAGFDDTRREIVVGIIDCIRTYTWDKKLETWIKDRGKNKPTITSPKDYRNRFRIAMAKYILQAPNCWHQFTVQQIQRKPLRLEPKSNMDGAAQVLQTHHSDREQQEKLENVSEGQLEAAV